ncbi:hypothetical protein E2C01_051875 [Portunus trituberculatus]|uniref:Uncharacterized protein n=1 Tax=Portunus trituberculatus TaxID=210409 RepID=A0A5B7GKI4_PORTR|nr:hypothetical protein [Portunus trituberculatus]
MVRVSEMSEWRRSNAGEAGGARERPGSLPKLENWQNLRSGYSEGGVSTSRFGEFTRHKFSRLPLIAARRVHCADGALDGGHSGPLNQDTETRTDMTRRNSLLFP